MSCYKFKLYEYNATNVQIKVSNEYCLIYDYSRKYIKKLHGLSPRANYNDRATAACRQSDCQLLRIEGATWSA
jgi:hypothetical protein